MDAALSGRSGRRMPNVLRIVLRRGTRVGHYCSSAIGFIAVISGLALWFSPAARSAIAERMMPVMSGTLDDAMAIGLLSARPAVGATSVHAGLATLQGPSAVETNANAPAPADGVGAGLGPFGAPLDPNNLPSVVRLAQPIKIVAEARYDRLAAPTARDQERVASYIARRYRVAQEPIDTLVQASFQTGRDVGLDPLLLLAVMAVESSFNPYAESGVGARGLMQVMPDVHSDKFEYYGGAKAALDPMPNLRVGALILKEYIGSTGSVSGGLKRYVGAATTAGDGGYGAKVLAERVRLRDAMRDAGQSRPPATTPGTALASAGSGSNISNGATNGALNGGNAANKSQAVAGHASVTSPITSPVATHAAGPSNDTTVVASADPSV
jgi:soluble lytic murein transglycosylase-like protein